MQASALYQWIDCGTGQPVVNGSSRFFTATRNGSYACIINKGSCIDTSECVSITTIDVEDVPGYHFNLFPNPNNGTFTIQHNFEGNVQLHLVNSIGSLVRTFNLTGQTEQINIADLAAGVYQAVLINDKQQLAVIKLVKQ